MRAGRLLGRSHVSASALSSCVLLLHKHTRTQSVYYLPRITIHTVCSLLRSQYGLCPGNVDLIMCNIAGWNRRALAHPLYSSTVFTVRGCTYYPYCARSLRTAHTRRTTRPAHSAMHSGRMSKQQVSNATGDCETGTLSQARFW